MFRCIMQVMEILNRITVFYLHTGRYSVMIHCLHSVIIFQMTRVFLDDNFTKLSHSCSMFLFYTPCKHQKTKGLLMFGRGYKIGNLIRNGSLSHAIVSIYLYVLRYYVADTAENLRLVNYMRTLVQNLLISLEDCKLI